MITPKTVEHGGQVRALRSFKDMDFPKYHHWVGGKDYLVAIYQGDIFVSAEGLVAQLAPDIADPMFTMRYLNPEHYAEFEPVAEASGVSAGKKA